VRVVAATAPARVALAGNPSDGFGGRTISLAIANYAARVTVNESNAVEIHPLAADRTRFDDVDDLVRDVRVNGYYGGVRLLKAAVHRLAAICAERGTPLGEKLFAIEYETSIPRGVGLGGSSAIVTAALTALADFCDVALDQAELPAAALAVETEELGIAAGLQDRVAQAEGGLTFMDFDPKLVAAQGRGAYERLDPGLLPGLFVAHLARSAEPSEVFHARLRHRFESGEPAVVEAMRELATIATRARDAVAAGDGDALGAAMDETFEVRRSIAQLDARHVRMIELARSLGASANYAGSGGAIVGTCSSAEHAEELARAFDAEGCALELCRPSDGAQALPG
jgi:glucuronokinase